MILKENIPYYITVKRKVMPTSVFYTLIKCFVMVMLALILNEHLP
jgi:hypothetical protein